MEKNTSLQVITTKVTHLMATGMVMAPISIGMDKYIKEVGLIVYEMVKVKINTLMVMFMSATMSMEKNKVTGHLHGKMAWFTREAGQTINAMAMGQ